MPQDSPLGPQLGNPFKLTRRTEDSPLVDLSDFQPPELSGFGPALT